MPDHRPPRGHRARGAGNTSRAATATRRVDPARLAAWEVLRAVEQDDAYANLVLPARLTARGLTGRDAAFATELAAGTLRRQGTYDAIIAASASRPLARVQPPVLDVLRLGAHQILGMRVPVHAAVSSSVDLVRSTVGPGATGFVNAVLRRLARGTWDSWVLDLAPAPEDDPRGHAALAHAHPRWVVEALTDALGDRGDELDGALAADNETPRVTVSARPGLCDRQELLRDGAEPAAYSPLAAVVPGGDPGRLKAVRDGRAAIQDEGSQLVALALLRAPVTGRDAWWLDLCAGPGGKAGLLGAEAAVRGARLLAVERQPRRAALVARAVRRLAPGTVAVIAADGTVPAWLPGAFDRALVDAPCTGLGALRRRPEARWRRSPDDLVTLVPLQRALLEAALDAVRPGGLVGYVTCSPVLEETAGVVEAVLHGRDDVLLEDATATLPEVRDADGPLPGTVQLWPHRHHTDAMFLALLRRR